MIGDELGLAGWHLDRQQKPDSLHLTVSYGNIKAVDQFIEDLSAAVEKVRKPSFEKIQHKVTKTLVKGAGKVLPEKAMSKLTHAFSGMKTGVPQRTAAMYGLMGALPNHGDLKVLVTNLLDNLNTLD
jgi:hypothetical protein